MCARGSGGGVTVASFSLCWRSTASVIVGHPQSDVAAADEEIETKRHVTADGEIVTMISADVCQCWPAHANAHHKGKKREPAV